MGKKVAVLALLALAISACDKGELCNAGGVSDYPPVRCADDEICCVLD